MGQSKKKDVARKKVLISYIGDGGDISIPCTVTNKEKETFFVLFHQNQIFKAEVV